MSVYLEERLLLRLADFFNMGWNAPDPAALPDESDYEAQRIVTKVLAANAKRYYFGDLAIVPSQIRLSVLTASKLAPHLGELKKSLGLTLIKFEDASMFLLIISKRIKNCLGNLHDTHQCFASLAFCCLPDFLQNLVAS